MRKQIAAFVATGAISVGSLFSQSPSNVTTPVKAKRVTSGPKVSDQQVYDFAGQLRTLQDPTGMDAPKPSPVGGASASDGKVPKSFQPRSDVPLSPTAQEAVRVSETWRGGQNTPAAGSDGRVVYVYGPGLPILVCAPLRVCMIELQPGEKITSEPQIGDSVRWNISPATYGQGEESTSVIVLKPQEPGLDTNLLITTDRRAYYLRLVSKPQEYVARVAFSYPDDDNSQKWQQHLLAQRAQAQEARHDAQVTPALATAEKLNFSYKMTGGNEQVRPLRVFDDGAKTYIQMRPDIKHREAPVLVVLGSDGKGEMTNYRVQDQTYVVDRLFERAQLVLGVGKKAQKVEISREQQSKG